MAVTQHINCNSDFVVPVVFYINGERVPVPLSFPWRIKISTGGSLSHQAFIASYDGENFVNCKLANDSILLVLVRGHHLGIGKVEATLEAELPNPLYDDGVMRVSLPVNTYYELWQKGTDYVVPSPDVEAAIGYMLQAEPTKEPDIPQPPIEAPKQPKNNDILIVRGMGGLDEESDVILTSNLGTDWQNGYQFNLVISNFTDEMLDWQKYRLAYMFTRKAGGRGRKWSVPMFGSIIGTDNASPLGDTYVAITGKYMPVHIPFIPRLFTREKKRNWYIAQTNSTKMKVGVAIFKKGDGNPGWWRCSNILGVEYYLGNISKDKQIKKGINTRYISE